jgi:hypothetical protein
MQTANAPLYVAAVVSDVCHHIIDIVKVLLTQPSFATTYVRGLHRPLAFPARI